MKISPFTPLHFSEANRSDGMPSRFIQLWAPTDQILVEVIASAGDTAPSASLNDAHTGSVIGPVEWNEWKMNADKVVFFSVLT